ncbi:MAG: PIG-L family deacetylase [Frankiaceae bacterium]|nr:PIG-L family deacetylase [Frankiaceae bacterium]
MVALTVISPHLDDAVLSLGCMLRGSPGATVVTCFGGVPDKAARLADWDRRCGYPDPATAATARRANDAVSVSRVGAQPVHLDLLDCDYRVADDRTRLADLERALAAVVGSAESLWLPVALGRHPDHVLALKAGLAVWRSSHRPPLTLYADLPYASTFGWPRWVINGGRPRLPLAWSRHVLRWRRHEVAMQWSGALATSGVPVHRLTPTVRPVIGSDLVDKLTALEPYSEQTAQLTYGPGGTWTLAQSLEYEAWWTLSG